MSGARQADAGTGGLREHPLQNAIRGVTQWDRGGVGALEAQACAQEIRDKYDALGSEIAAYRKVAQRVTNGMIEIFLIEGAEDIAAIFAELKALAEGT